MKVSVSVVPDAHFPPPHGAHEMAWAYILDAVFADAHSTGVSSLDIILPLEAVRTAARLRADLSAVGRPSSAGATAVLAAGHTTTHADRIYHVDLGLLAGERGAWARARGAQRPTRSVSVFTLHARLAGLAIRTGGALNTPALTDAGIARMRRSFVAPGWKPAFYHLSQWGATEW